VAAATAADGSQPSAGAAAASPAATASEENTAGLTPAPTAAINPADLPPTGVDFGGGAWPFLLPLLLVMGLFTPSLAKKLHQRK